VGIEAISVAGERASGPIQDEAQAITAFSAEDVESLTNTQEKGVDEGDLIKRFGSHLLLLRRGRLFNFEVGTRAGDRIRKVAQLDLVPPELSRVTGGEKEGWYDELVVFGKTIVVVGYSYEPVGTELVIIDMETDGKLIHRDTYFIPSFDYYSGENYATRVIGDEFFFYMPISLTDLEDGEGPGLRSLPYLHFAGGRGSGETRPLLSELRIRAPLLHTLNPLMHTIVRCSLSVKPLVCRAEGIIAPDDAELYFSSTAAYLWVGGERWRFAYSALSEAWIRGWVQRDLESDEERSRRALGLVYRLPLDSRDAGVVSVDGAPINQFSFRELGESLQLVLQRGASPGLHWIEVPLTAFGTRANAASGPYLALEDSGEGCELNRFIGKYLLYGNCWGGEIVEERLGAMAKFLPDRRAAQWIETGFVPSRIEPVGVDALIVGHREDSDREEIHLGLSTVSLGQRPEVLDTRSFANSAEAEGRSHAFNYTRINGRLLLGLPMVVAHWPRGVFGLWAEPSLEMQVRFFEWTVAGQLEDLGPLKQAPVEFSRPDDCTVSCTDWYGAARPLFMDDRILALIDYELIEGAWGARGISEVQRASALDP
jgi:hypothetical protein